TVEAPVLRVPFSNGSRRGELLLQTGGATLFAEDDLALLEVLGIRALSAAEREEVLAERSALAERLAATNVELSRASAAKSEFLAAMSHELRTPLNAIIGFSELLGSPPGGGEPALADVRQFAGHIHGAGLHLLELINDILDLSRVEAGRLELRHEPVDVVTLVAETLATVRPLAEARQHDLVADLPSALAAEVDPARLRQVAYNLLSNAIKFTPPGGRVSVELAREQEAFRLTVSDSGPGIDPADQARVFAAFEQLTPGSAEGTGLGLALTRRLVEAHGGRIELESAPGSGSRFSARLPLRRAMATQPATVEPDDGQGPLVLVIEDDVDAAQLLRVQLHQAGYRVAVAADGESGLQTAHTLAPAAILLDVLLPGLDGWEVLRRLRADPTTGAIPVMVITIVDNAALGLALGAVDYLVKPVARETLLAALGRLSLTTKVGGRPVTVLAIDDDPAALALYRGALSPEGFRVIGAATGEEGLARARSEPVDAIVLDLLLPGLDGFQVAARLKADTATADTPILVITGHELSDADKERLNEHVRDVLAKGDGALAGLRAWLSRIEGEPEG
ncbi:MAG: response regulator, partial [Candidatus Limnocylindria bacterium]